MDGKCAELEADSSPFSIVHIKSVLDERLPPYHEVKFFHNGQELAEGP